MYDEDEDEFLYGSSAKRQKTEDSDEEPDYEPALGPSHVVPVATSDARISESSLLTATADKVKQDRDEDDEEGDDEDEDDSDIEFVIDSKPGADAEPPAGKAGSYSSKPDAKSQANTVAAAGVDLSKVPELDGKLLTETDLDNFEDKPWRKPGADVTDYFNYGFDEFSWTTYCLRQDAMREEYDANKLMAVRIWAKKKKKIADWLGLGNDAADADGIRAARRVSTRRRWNWW
ncbi:Fip1 motif-domain-containing protein [Lipomyces japonicus]|uniref:Fip1 motif-domain-containing protein n=1 Tax=Lipomyces japonicus TaxID=56871 RepID=UPI0034CD689F